MSKYFSNIDHTMQRNAALLTVMCIIVFLSFNYTFPLHKERAKWSPIGVFANHSPARDKTTHHENIAERTKKTVNDIDKSLRKIKDSTQVSGKNLNAHINTGMKCSEDKNTLSEDDLRQYEQLVIMKKYPYLDLKELDLKYSPSSKNNRQSIKYDSESNLGNDPSICEPVEDELNVEIINRGLSGVAIPAKLKSQKNFDDINKNTKLIKSPEHSVLENLQDAILQYEERKNIIKNV